MRFARFFHKHGRLSAACRTAVQNHGVIQIQCQGMEKYNNDGLPDVPRADGHFDVEGHQWVDVDAHYRLDLLNIHELQGYIKGIATWIFDLISVRSLTYSKETLPFSIARQQWVWCVESFDAFKNSSIDDKLTAYYGCPEVELKAMRADYQAYSKKRDDILETVTHDEIRDAVLMEHTEIIPGIYASVSDPTNLVVDEMFLPYDYKDGWSDRTVREIIQCWCRREFGPTVKVRLTENQAYSKVTVDLKRAIVESDRDIKAGRVHAVTFLDDLLEKKGD